MGPVAADTECLTRMAVEAIRKIGSDPTLQGVHMSVGLSNISIMVPAKAVPAVIDDCAAVGVKAATIFSAGFAETGEDNQTS